MCHGKVFYGRGALCVRRGPFSRYRQYAPAAGRSGVARPYRPSARPASRSVGRPVAVNSGYRSPALNAAVGGAPRSRAYVRRGGGYHRGEPVRQCRAVRSAGERRVRFRPTDRRARLCVAACFVVQDESPAGAASVRAASSYCCGWRRAERGIAAGGVLRMMAL